MKNRFFVYNMITFTLVFDDYVWYVGNKDYFNPLLGTVQLLIMYFFLKTRSS